LLRALLPVPVVSPSPAHQRLSSQMGVPEVQTAAPPGEKGTGTAGSHGSPVPEPVRPLAVRRQARRLDDGSRVSREAPARFCERRRVRLPPPTHLILRTERSVRARAQQETGHVPRLVLPPATASRA